MQSAVLHSVLTLLLVTFVLSDFASSAQADERAVDVVLPEVFPWSYENDAGQMAGVLVELTRRLGELSAVPLSPRLRPHRRAVAELTKGRADFAMLFESPQTRRGARSVGRLISTRLVAVTLPGQATPGSFDQLSDKSVVQIHGTHHGEAYQAARKRSTHAVTDLQTALKLLRMERVEVLVTFDYALHLTLDSMGHSRDSVSTAILAPGKDGHLYMSRESHASGALEPIRQALEQLRGSGELARILRGPAVTP